MPVLQPRPYGPKDHRHLQLQSISQNNESRLVGGAVAPSSQLSDSTVLGSNQLFRSTDIDQSIFKYIQTNNFGRRRRRKVRPNNRPRTPEPAAVHSSLSNADAVLILPIRSLALNRSNIPCKFFLRRNRLRLACSAASPDQFPSDTSAEVAFIGTDPILQCAQKLKLKKYIYNGNPSYSLNMLGRSNVGKSSLINAIADSTVVRVSDRPGETRSVDFYSVGTNFGLVDLPGYGFAYASESQAETWRHLVKSFLSSRKSLRRTLVLIDSRVGLKSTDMQLMELLDELRVTYQVILTKSDLVPPVDLARRASIVKRAIASQKRAVAEVLIVSARTRTGVSSLRSHLLGLASGSPNEYTEAPRPHT
jgi:ribosome biogenesis GTP-binding protein YsxC/EngB